MIAEVQVWPSLSGAPVLAVVPTDLLLERAVRVGSVLDHAEDRLALASFAGWSVRPEPLQTTTERGPGAPAVA